MDQTTSEKIQASGITVSRRITDLDVLRGIALFGILVVNLMLFAHPMYIFVADINLEAGPVDQFAEFFIRTFFEGKFITLFSFLFGIGFWILMNRMQERNQAASFIFARRMFFLALLGLTHAMFFWSGDILLPYAICGVLLLFFFNRTDRTLKVWIGLVLGIVLFINILIVGLVMVGMSVPEAAEEITAAFEIEAERYTALMAKGYEVYSSGSFAEMVSFRRGELSFVYFGLMLSPAGFGWIFSVFLFGLYVARKGDGLLTNPQLLRERFIPRRRSRLIIGLIICAVYAGASMQANSISLDHYTIIVLLTFMVGTPLLLMGYIGYILQALRRFEEKNGNYAPGAFLHLFAPAGRMALTNYLMQSVLCTTIFLGYGFGLYGKTGYAASIPIAIAIFSFQIFLSRMYLNRFKMGPFEWLWRKVTYLK
ncbi:MAG: DUF418 domain-containing protein [Balneolales bacterium]|nr:DUF418 domain-containing protein [Balneolales bacterium]